MITLNSLPISDTSGYVFGPTEILVLNDPMNPNGTYMYCCNGIVINIIGC